MTETEKALIRYIFQHILSTQDRDVYRWLYCRFVDMTDNEDAAEMMRAWKHFEGWIASHGLEQ